MTTMGLNQKVLREKVLRDIHESEMDYLAAIRRLEGVRQNLSEWDEEKREARISRAMYDVQYSRELLVEYQQRLKDDDNDKETTGRSV
jgi:uncharacterized protein YdiU (UPF0061 family)